MGAISPSLTSGDSIDPHEAKKLESWIRRKYEHKEFALKGGASGTEDVPEPKVLVQRGQDPTSEYLIRLDFLERILVCIDKNFFKIRCSAGHVQLVHRF